MLSTKVSKKHIGEADDAQSVVIQMLSKEDTTLSATLHSFGSKVFCRVSISGKREFKVEEGTVKVSALNLTVDLKTPLRLADASFGVVSILLWIRFIRSGLLTNKFGEG